MLAATLLISRFLRGLGGQGALGVGQTPAMLEQEFFRASRFVSLVAKNQLTAVAFLCSPQIELKDIGDFPGQEVLGARRALFEQTDKFMDVDLSAKFSGVELVAGSDLH